MKVLLHLSQRYQIINYCNFLMILYIQAYIFNYQVKNSTQMEQQVSSIPQLQRLNEDINENYSHTQMRNTQMRRSRVSQRLAQNQRILKMITQSASKTTLWIIIGILSTALFVVVVAIGMLLGNKNSTVIINSIPATIVTNGVNLDSSDRKKHETLKDIQKAIILQKNSKEKPQLLKTTKIVQNQQNIIQQTSLNATDKFLFFSKQPIIELNTTKKNQKNKGEPDRVNIIDQKTPKTKLSINQSLQNINSKQVKKSNIILSSQVSKNGSQIKANVTSNLSLNKNISSVKPKITQGSLANQNVSALKSNMTLNHQAGKNVSVAKHNVTLNPQVSKKASSAKPEITKNVLKNKNISVSSPNITSKSKSKQIVSIKLNTTSNPLVNKNLSSIKPNINSSLQTVKNESSIKSNILVNSSLKSINSSIKPQAKNQQKAQKSSKFEIPKIIWIFTEQNITQSYAYSLIKKNQLQFARKNNFTIHQLTEKTFMNFLNKDKVKRIQKLKGQFIAKHFKINETIKFSQKRNTIISQLYKDVIIFNVLLQKGGIFIDKQILLTESFEWLESIDKNPYVNRDLRDNGTEVFAFFDLKYSAPSFVKNYNTKFDITKPYRMFKELPGVTMELIAAKPNAVFLREVCQALMDLLTDPKKEFEEMLKNEWLMDLFKPEKYYSQFSHGFLVSALRVLKRQSEAFNHTNIAVGANIGNVSSNLNVSSNTNQTNKNNVTVKSLLISQGKRLLIEQGTVVPKQVSKGNQSKPNVSQRLTRSGEPSKPSDNLYDLTFNYFRLSLMNSGYGPKRLQYELLPPVEFQKKYLTSVSQEELQAMFGPIRYCVFLPQAIRNDSAFFEEIKNRTQLVTRGSFLQRMCIDTNETGVVQNKEQPRSDPKASEWSALPKRLWVIWDTGLEHTSLANQLMIRRLLKQATQYGLNATLITSQNLHLYLQESIIKRIDDAINKTQIKLFPTIKSDLSRIALVYKYGGIYIDASVIMIKGFDWLFKIAQFRSDMVWNRFQKTPKIIFGFNPWFENSAQWEINVTHNTKSSLQLGYQNCFFAAEPQSQLLKDWFELYINNVLNPYNHTEMLLNQSGLYPWRYTRGPQKTYLIAMQSLRLTIFAKQRQLDRSGLHKWGNANHYYGAWFINMFSGISKYRCFVYNNFNLDNPGCQWNSWLTDYSLEYTEGLIGQANCFIKLHRRDVEYFNQILLKQMDNFQSFHPKSVIRRYLLSNGERLVNVSGVARWDFSRQKA